MLRIRSLCLTQLKQKGVFRPVGSLNEQFQDELTADDRHRQLAMPIDEDEKELNPSEQDENYGRTHFQLLSHTKLYQSMVTGKHDQNSMNDFNTHIYTQTPVVPQDVVYS